MLFFAAFGFFAYVIAVASRSSIRHAGLSVALPIDFARRFLEELWISLSR